MLHQTLMAASFEMELGYSRADKHISLYIDTNGFNYILMTGMIGKLLCPDVDVDVFHAIRLSCHHKQIESAFYTCEFFCLYLDCNSNFTKEAQIPIKIYKYLENNTLSNLIYEKYKIPTCCKRSRIFNSCVCYILKQQRIHNFMIKKLYSILTK